MTQPPANTKGLGTTLSWALVGNGTYILCQFAVFLAIAQFTSPEELGRFGFAAALSTPIFMFTNLGLRLGQSTDSQADGRADFAFGTYLGLRTLMSLLGAVTVIGIGFLIAPDAATIPFIIMIALARIAESYSDLFYGVFQKDNRLNLMARSLILRGVVSVLFFTLILWQTGDVALSLVAQLIVWACVARFHDYRLAAPAPLGHADAKPDFAMDKLVPLARLSLPLGGGAFLGQLVTNAPRFVVEYFFGLAALGYFTAIAYVYQTGQFFVAAIGHALIARIARLHKAGQRRDLYRLVFSMAGAMIGLGALGVVAGVLLGKWVLGVAFGPDFAAQETLLIIVLGALTFALAAAIMQTAIAGLRKFKSFALIHAVLLPINLALTITGAQMAGLNGVGWGMLGTSAAHLLLTIGLFVVAERRQHTANAKA